MHSACESEDVPVDEVFEEEVLADDTVLDRVALEVDVVEMDGEDVLAESAQVFGANPGGESLIIVGVFSNIFLVKGVAIVDGDDNIDGVFGEGIGVFGLGEDS